nr:hypothetical protein L203_05585 [Cryptococcus depauperatus CBS 7841]
MHALYEKVAIMQSEFPYILDLMTTIHVSPYTPYRQGEGEEKMKRGQDTVYVVS